MDIQGSTWLGLLLLRWLLLMLLLLVLLLLLISSCKWVCVRRTIGLGKECTGRVDRARIERVGG